MRWSAARKAQLARDLGAGLISPQELQDRHAMSVEEADQLVRAYSQAGEEGLKLKALKERRPA